MIAHKKTFLQAVSHVLFILLGSACTCFFLSLIDRAPVFSLSYHYWSMIASLLVIGIFLVQISLMKLDKFEQKILQEEAEEQQEKSLLSHNNVREDFENFKRDAMHAFKSSIKISSLFWIYFLKKEKVLSFEEAKKEVFRTLKKEFQSVSWMSEALSDLKKDMTKYEKSVKDGSLHPEEIADD